MIDSESPPSAAEARRIQELGATLDAVRAEIRQRVVGQDDVVEQLLISLLAEGHCLIVGVPGLAKTLLVSTISELVALSFKRIQFTPDLMPADITGATIIALDRRQGQRALKFLPGPIFSNILLADEINRTPPKTQAALMEAMEERQVTAAGRTHRLERPFFVLATQNPIEQEGTYPLPVSQLDRFLLNVLIDYPTHDEEFEMVERTTSTYQGSVRQLLDRESILEALSLTRRVEVPHRRVDYVTRIVRASRPGVHASETVRDWVSWGGGPRAVQAILQGSRARALMHGRAEIEDEDIHRMTFPALRHRIVLNYHALAEGLDPDRVIEQILLGMPDGLYRLAPPPSPARSRWGLVSRFFGR